jgi:transcriptional regulator with XRE-family HTH domain
METMQDLELDRRLGARIKALRLADGLTLDQLAERSGVSRAMISRVERGESSPTAALLDRVCVGLGTVLSALFREAAEVRPLARRAEQPLWTDPGSGYVRRGVSPPGTGSRIEIVEIEMPPGGRVLLDAARATQRLDQQVWVLAGEMVVTLGDTEHALAAGDCLQMLLDGPIAYHNPGPLTARYAVVLTGHDRPAFEGRQ